MSRKANSAPLPRKSRKSRSRAYSLGPDYLNRPIYVIGERHTSNYRATTRHKILSVSNPIIFSEYGMSAANYGLSDEFIKDSEELGAIGIHFNLLHLLCGLQKGWNQRLLTHFTLLYTELKETYYMQYEDIDAFILQPDHYDLTDIKYILLQSTAQLLSNPVIRDIVEEYGEYVKEIMENIVNCEDAGYKPMMDNNVAVLRDAALFAKVESHKRTHHKTPFVIIVGKKHIPNWKILLKDYNNVKYI